MASRPPTPEVERPHGGPAAPAAVPPLGDIMAMLTVINARLASLETSSAAAVAAGRATTSNDIVPKKDLTNPRVWKVSHLSTGLQQRVLIDELTKYYGESMFVPDKEGRLTKERSRDYYELQSLFEILATILPTAVVRAGVRPIFTESDTDIMVPIIVRATLLKEKAEKGVADMKFLEKRLNERGLVAELEEPVKELRARQQQQALFRAAQGGKSNKDHSSA